MPPIHVPFFLEAATLSRIRSPMTSRSNWAKDKRTFEAARTKQHHALAVAAEITRAQPRRKHLPIYARQLALKPHLQILRRHFGPLLFCLEQTHRHALENNVHRHAIGLIGHNQRDSVLDD